MEIKTCEQYVLSRLDDLEQQNADLNCKLNDAEAANKMLKSAYGELLNDHVELIKKLKSILHVTKHINCEYILGCTMCSFDDNHEEMFDYFKDIIESDF